MNGDANLLTGVPDELPQELVQPLLERGALRIERIVSRGHATPTGEWFDQDTDEWVAVLAGRGVLRFAERSAPLALGVGDHVFIPAHCRHRVEWTDPQQATIWLAVHLRGAAAGGAAPA